MPRETVAGICKNHGFWKGNVCPKCVPDSKINMGIKTDEWVKGWWEHIAKEPIYIENKKQLIEECNKRGVMPKVLTKPRSQGNGWEWKKRI